MTDRTETTKLGGTFTFKGTGKTVHRMGYGTMRLTGEHIWGPPKDREGALAVLREAVAAGVNHIDTADFYGPHVANELVKEALFPYPKDLTIVTKVGYRRGEDQSWLPAYSKAEVTKAVEENLKRLGLESLPVVNLRAAESRHGEHFEMERELEILLALKAQGLIQHLGVSNVTVEQYEAARKVTEIVCVQNEYNLAKRGDDALIDRLAAEAVAYVPFFPLGGFTPLQSGMLDEVAKELDATAMQVALAWLLQRSPNILVIAGTSSVMHLHENLKAAELTLSAEVVGRLNAMSVG